MRKVFAIVCVFAIVSIAQRAMAATVILNLEPDGPGRYKVRARASQGDNFGIASYSFMLTDVLTIDHISPQDGFASGPGGTGPAGFTVLRTADNDPSGTVFASQDTIAPTPNLIYGFGQAADSFANLGMTDFTGGFQLDQPAWDADLLLATGTYDPGRQSPAFFPGNFELFLYLLNR